MAILRPDATTTLNGVKINEYLLTKHNPNHIDMPSVSMAGKIIGVTVHNTDWITVASGTTPAEQYTRATVNNNMKDVRVHYYVDNICAWQNLPHSLSGWHAADGSGNGNRRTIAIECIMSSAYNSVDKKSEDNAAKLAAALLKQYGLDINHLYTHTHWLNVRDGRNGTIDQLNTMYNRYKMCPAYILPHWTEFKKKVQSYLNAGTPTISAPSTKQLYRVRKSWADTKSQLGAYSSLENAKKACKVGYSVFDANGNAVYTNGGKFTKGQKIAIRANTPLFASAETTSVTRRISGTYYLYDGIACKNGRYRITTKPEFCGKTPVGQYVTGYVSWDNSESCPHCPQCGRSVVQTPHRKPKRFCSTQCHNTWWNHHAVSGDGKLQQLCPICKEPFFAYPSSHRKYCSRLCYGKYRKEMAHGKRTLP